MAIPFWNDTQLDDLPKNTPEHSPYQEVFAARVPNVPSRGGARAECFRAQAQGGQEGDRARPRRPVEDDARHRLGPPSRRRGRVWSYCVQGGGKLVLVFDRRKRVRFVASTARGHKRLGIGPRTSARRLLRSRAFRRGGLIPLKSGVYRLRRGRSRRVVFGVRRGRVRFVGVTDRRLLRKRGALIRTARRAGLAPRRRPAR